MHLHQNKSDLLSQHPSDTSLYNLYLVLHTMKTLKFTPELVEKIISGEKRATWRLFDDKHLTIGDEIQLVNKETSHIFGTAIITSLYTKTLGTLTEADWVGHEPYSSIDEMYTDFRRYYGDAVIPDTEAKIISFSFESLQ